MDEKMSREQLKKAELELKALVFDIVNSQEGHQLTINKLENRKVEELKKLRDIQIALEELGPEQPSK